MKRLSIFMIGCLLLTACSESGPSTLTKKEEIIDNSPKEEVVTTNPEATPKTPSVKISDEEAQALVKEWLKAQNDGVFESYKSLYASKFEGVKRVSDKVFRYDKEGWLKDRKRMFKKPMVVEARGVKVISTPHVVLVQFEQTWASGSYKDVGMKQLVLFKEKDDLLISKEEMLNSNLLVNQLNMDAQELQLVVRNKYIVLSTLKNESWISPNSMDLVNATTVKRGVIEQNIPKDYQVWKSKNVFLYDIQGNESSAKVKELSLLTLAQLHFAVEQDYQSGIMSKEEYAQNICDVGTEGYTYLVAELDTDVKGMLASTTSRTGQITTTIKVTEEDQRELLSAWKNESSYQKIQKGFEKEGIPEVDAWVDYESNKRFASFEWEGATYYYAFVTAGFGCGEYFVELAGLWKKEGGKIKYLGDVKIPNSFLKGFVPDFISDFDGDGNVELWNNETLLIKKGAQWEAKENIQEGYFSCAC
ncbi:MAG: hypothetical protein GY827_06885 [Cytophagales bacterium]|nr:hypothetical protein [Cytophagales bacterium]